MKQTEKLDKIMRYLYDNRSISGYYSVKDICEELKIPIDDGEAWKLGQRLSDENLVKANGTFDDMFVEINSYGIDYVEEDSFSKHGSPINPTINNFYVSQSTNTSIVNNSENVSINQIGNNVFELIDRILKAVQVENISPKEKGEIQECLAEIKQSIETGGRPKFAYKSLVSLTADLTTIAAFVMELGKATGLLV